MEYLLHKLRINPDDLDTTGRYPLHLFPPYVVELGFALVLYKQQLRKYRHKDFYRIPEYQRLRYSLIEGLQRGMPITIDVYKEVKEVEEDMEAEIKERLLKVQSCSNIETDHHPKQIYYEDGGSGFTLTHSKKQKKGGIKWLTWLKKKFS